ncbi:MAG TPA: hypothetical protein DCO77_14430 [Nitrospiraceae bacterium]|nr:hypothetical protein [Nitrospiraceae bacterium]
MMEKYLITLAFLLAAFLLMALSLHFSKYKKSGSGCCGRRAPGKGGCADTSGSAANPVTKSNCTAQNGNADTR